LKKRVQGPTSPNATRQKRADGQLTFCQGHPLPARGQGRGIQNGKRGSPTKTNLTMVKSPDNHTGPSKFLVNIAGQWFQEGNECRPLSTNVPKSWSMCNMIIFEGRTSMKPRRLAQSTKGPLGFLYELWGYCGTSPPSLSVVIRLHDFRLGEDEMRPAYELSIYLP
jgi:hypothetical protein